MPGTRKNKFNTLQSPCVCAVAGVECQLRARFLISDQADDPEDDLFTRQLTQLSTYACSALQEIGPELAVCVTKTPKRFVLVSWPSMAAFQAAAKAQEATKSTMLRWKLVSYDLPQSSPLHGVILPAVSPQRYLLAFRIVLSGKSCLHLLILSPTKRPGQLDKPKVGSFFDMKKMLEPDAGYQRQCAGRCSNCGLRPEKLYLCVGCSVHSYCGAGCQKVAWSAHRPLCKSIQAWKKQAAARRPASAAEAV